MSTTTDRYLCYPAAATGISRASSGGAAYSFSAWTQIAAAGAIHASNTIYLSGLTWCWHTPCAAVDTTYQWIIEIGSGGAGAETTIIQIPASIRADTLVGYVPSNIVMLPEPIQLTGGNPRLSVRVAYSLLTTSNTLTGIKLLYHMV